MAAKEGKLVWPGWSPTNSTTWTAASTPAAAEGRQTAYHATDTTIGIRGPDAADRINQLRHALAKLITNHGWTTRDEPR